MFAQLEFVMTTTTKPGDHSAGTNMTNPAVDDVIISTLIALAMEGHAFTARVIGLDRFADLLIASDGREVVTVPTFGSWRAPAVRMDQNGRCSDEEARKYWSIKANFENALVRKEVRA
jgi:hypothetical protein